MKATLTFSDRNQAHRFATAWSFYSLRGHVMGSGTEIVTVTLYDVTDEDRLWIDAYVARLRESIYGTLEALELAISKDMLSGEVKDVAQKAIAKARGL